MRIVLALLLMMLAALAGPLRAFAQETPEEERSWLLGYVEDQLSGPNRRIRLNGIEGALSSNAVIREITIADNQGVWLRIVNASIVWTRTALILSQRLEIESLGAERIEVLRKPVADESMPAPETGGFAIPELPVGVNLARLEVPLVTFGPDVFGLESQIAVTGRLKLEGGSLDTGLEIRRLDGPGGNLNLAATYGNADKVLNLDFALAEPANGVVANVLGVEGRPPMALTLKGAGPLDALDVALALDADGQRTLTGNTRLRRQAGGLGFDADLSGPVARLIPPLYRDFFGADSRLTASGTVRDAGGFELAALNLTSGALTLNASAETTADSFLRRLALDAAVQDASGRVVLPVAGGETSVAGARLAIDFGGDRGEAWNGMLDLSGLTTGTFSAETVALTLGGLAQNLDRAAERRVTFTADGKVSGIVAERADVAEALGKELTLAAAGAWSAGAPLAIESARLTGNGLSVALQGNIAESAFNGTVGVDAASIVPFSALAGRPVAGALDLEATGRIEPLTGAFDLGLNGIGTDLQLGVAAVERLLAGATTITGRLARGEAGLTADNLRLGNDRFAFTADGTFATGKADFGIDAELTDLALLSDRAAGKLTASGRATGADGLIGLSFGAAVPEGMLAGKRLADAALTFEGTLRDGLLDGQTTGSAFLDGTRVELASGISVAEADRRLTGLTFRAGGATLTGDLAQATTGLLTGKLELAAADISTAAALFLAEARGAVNAVVTLAPEGDKQGAQGSASLVDVVVNDTSVGRAGVEARVADLFGVPGIDGKIDASNVTAGGVQIATLKAEANLAGNATRFSGDAALANGATVSAAGTLAPEGEGYRIALENARLAQGQLAATLAAPASVAVLPTRITIDGLALDIGGGRLTASGTVADTIDLAVQADALPLAMANAVRPDLQLGGTVTGRAQIGGTRVRPTATFDVTGRGLSAAALRAAGLRAIDLSARGDTTADRLNIDASLTSPDGLNATARGAVPLDGGQLAVDVALRAFPLALLNTVAPGQRLAGTISGTARVGGQLADPSVTFDLNGARLSAAALADSGAAPLDLRASGRYARRVVDLTSATVNGPQGLSATLRGRIPLAGSGLDLSVQGDVPLALGNRLLAERGAQLSGTLLVNASVSGSLARPSLRGMFSANGAGFVDPQANLRLTGIALMGSLDGERVVLRSASAQLASGGTVSADGSISLAAGFPADLRVRLNGARYADGYLLVATVTGDLAVTGPLARDPLVSGALTLDRAEITVPESFAAGAAAIDVRHINPPPGVAATLRRARANDGTPMPSARPSVVRLDVTVNAPRRIFVRGRGLDAELGGSVRLTGPITDIQPVGAFNLIRGRLSIVGQRITFDEGTVTLVGDLDPFLNFVAQTGGSDITVFVTVSGRASDLDVSFSSQPQLPEDEVLARLIFNRGMGELSPLQIAQLAAAAAELAGGSNTSLLQSLRGATGLDDLDIVTDSEGNAAVRAGRYIQDNVYLGVEAGARGATRGTINLDITEDLKARGAVGSDGNSSLGVFFEKDY